MYNLSYLWIIWKSILPFWVTFNSTSLRYQRTMLNFLLFGFFDQFLPPTHTLIKEIVCEYLCYILVMSGLPLPSQWVANPGNSGLQVEDAAIGCVCVCVCVLSCSVMSECPTLYKPIDCSPPVSSVHGISRQEYWRGLPFPSPGDLPDPGIEPRSPSLQTDSLPSESPGKPILIAD